MSVKINSLGNTTIFESIEVGKNKLAHKVVFAPTTRYRSLPDRTPSNLNLQYYDDRTKIPGSLVITEATFVSEAGAGMKDVPGIWTESHVRGWSKVVEKVHKNGSFIALQGWFLGGAASPKLLKEAGEDYVGPSPIYPDKEHEKEAIEVGNPIRAVTEQEIHDLIYVTYTKAAQKAIEAGFDYFEIHSAHGYFLDQFLHPSLNQRADKYGGSVENRARFLIELIDHLINVIGADRLAVRLSPWATLLGVKPINDEVHPFATYSHILHQLQRRAERGDELAYVSIVEPRVNGNSDKKFDEQFGDNSFAYDVWKGIILRSGGYTYDAPTFNTLLKDTKGGRTLVGFSRFFISNPDLPERLRNGTPLTLYDRETFYDDNNWGYNTYNRTGENKAFDETVERKKLAQPINA